MIPFDLTCTNSSNNSGLVYLSVDGKMWMCFLDWPRAAAANFAADLGNETPLVDFFNGVQGTFLSVSVTL